MAPTSSLFPTFGDATSSYEQWLAGHVDLEGDDLRSKHALMAKNLVGLLRGSFYRWTQVWAGLCPGEAEAPSTGSVGDIHLENYGTWRDAEGRLAWGVNDFDEACLLPYTHDLVRVATSALVAHAEGSLPGTSDHDICAALLAGYERGLGGPVPIVLAENNGWLRQVADQRLKHRDGYWDGILADARGSPPTGEEEAMLRALLPAGSHDVSCFRRVAGIGSLGRRRLTAVATWNGARVAREMKALAPSASAWAGGPPSPPQDGIYAGSIRSPDPTYGFSGSWVTRRLGPDCSKLELRDLPGAGDRKKMLAAMSRELVNIHAGLGDLDVVRADWRTRSRHPGWLERSATVMAEHLKDDLAEWRQHRPT